MKAGVRTVPLLALALATVGTGARAEPCPAGNLLSGAGFHAERVSGSPQALIDRVLAPEGQAAASTGGIRLQDGDAALSIDLRRPRTIRSILIQGDGGAAFVIEGSADLRAWQPIWSPAVGAGSGLRTRTVDLEPPATARYLRLRAAGIGASAVSELALFCRPPPEWPPVGLTGGATAGRAAEAWPGRQTVGLAKLGLAVAGLLLLAADLVLRRAGGAGRARRLRDVLLAALALLAIAGWWNFGRFHFGAYLHTWEHFHYYVGSKYFSELDYTRLYECALIADVEAGLGEEVSSRTVRDLTTNELGPPDAILADPSRCKRHFGADRWREFSNDIAWFREQGGAAWSQTFRDHGYNPTPVWGLVGGALTRLGPASERTVLLLALIDPLLLLATAAILIWGFGWRAAAIVALWWGTNLVADYGWTGGGFLRQDWLLLAAAGLALVRRGRPALGGFALTWSTLIRVFPGFIIAALALRALLSMVERRSLRPEPAHLRFGAGCLAGLILLMPLSAWSAGGWSAWRGFIDNSRASTRSTGTNTVGLMSVLTYEPSRSLLSISADESIEDPQKSWLAGKRAAFTRRRPLFWLMLAGYLVLLGAAVRREDDAGALALGVGLIPIASFVACYYHSILGLAALRRDGERQGVGIGLCALSIFSHVALLVWRPPVVYDRRFAWISLATVVVVVSWTVLAAWRGRRTKGVDGSA